MRARLALPRLLVVVGIVVYFQSRCGRGADPRRHRRSKAQTPSEPTVKPGGKLTPAARRSRVEFIRTALARENLAQAWNLATPELREGVTKKQWLRGEIARSRRSRSRDLETTGSTSSARTRTRSCSRSCSFRSRTPDTCRRATTSRWCERAATAPWKVSYFLPVRTAGNVHRAEVAQWRLLAAVAARRSGCGFAACAASSARPGGGVLVGGSRR